MDTVPFEVLSIIVAMASPGDLWSLSVTCRSLNQVCSDRMVRHRKLMTEWAEFDLKKITSLRYLELVLDNITRNLDILWYPRTFIALDDPSYQDDGIEPEEPEATAWGNCEHGLEVFKLAERLFRSLSQAYPDAYLSLTFKLNHYSNYYPLSWVRLFLLLFRNLRTIRLEGSLLSGSSRWCARRVFPTSDDSPLSRVRRIELEGTFDPSKQGIRGHAYLLELPRLEHASYRGTVSSGNTTLDVDIQSSPMWVNGKKVFQFESVSISEERISRLHQFPRWLPSLCCSDRIVSLEWVFTGSGFPGEKFTDKVLRTQSNALAELKLSIRRPLWVCDDSLIYWTSSLDFLVNLRTLDLALDLLQFENYQFRRLPTLPTSLVSLRFHTEEPEKTPRPQGVGFPNVSGWDLSPLFQEFKLENFPNLRDIVLTTDEVSRWPVLLLRAFSLCQVPTCYTIYMSLEESSDASKEGGQQRIPVRWQGISKLIPSASFFIGRDACRFVDSHNPESLSDTEWSLDHEYRSWEILSRDPLKDPSSYPPHKLKVLSSHGDMKQLAE